MIKKTEDRKQQCQAFILRQRSNLRLLAQIRWA